MSDVKRYEATILGDAGVQPGRSNDFVVLASDHDAAIATLTARLAQESKAREGREELLRENERLTAKVAEQSRDMDLLREHYRQLGAESLGADLREAKDAARYRWLRFPRYELASPGRGYLIDLYSGDALDAKIDACLSGADGGCQS